MKLAALMVALLACTHAREPQGRVLYGWRGEHPFAADELCSFSRDYPTDASRLREWARNHPIQAAQMLDIAAEAGAPQASAFLSQQRDWTGYSPARDPALYMLLDWAYHRPEAAHDLAADGRGIERAMEGRSCSAP